MRKKLLMVIALLVSGVGNLWADDVFKDVTSTYLTNADFEGEYSEKKKNNNDRWIYEPNGWTYSYSSGNQYDCSALKSEDLQWNFFKDLPKATDGGSKTYWIRLYNDSGKGQRLELSQTVNLKGTFKFSAHAYFNNTGYGTAYIQINSSSNRTTVSSNATWSQISTSITNATESSTTLTCGAWHKQNSGHAIVGFDNVKLEWNLTQSLTDLLTEANAFYDTEGDSYTALKAVIDATDPSDTDADKLEAQYNALDAALKLAQARKDWVTAYNTLDELDEDALPGAAKTAITGALGASEPATIEGYNTAKAALQALIDSYDGIKAAYDKVNSLILLATSEKENSAGDADAKNTLNTAINTANMNKETRTTADALNGDYTTLENARQTYVTSGAEPAAGYPFEVTFKIVNPSFEQDGSITNTVPTGWTVPNKGAEYGTKPKGSTTNADGNYVFNNWRDWWQDVNVKQELTSLPNGRYQVTATLAGYSGAKNCKLEANGKIAWFSPTGAENGIVTSVNGDVTEGNLTIQAQGGATGDGQPALLRADKFMLSFIGLKPVLSDLISSANDLTTTNVGDGVFQIPSLAASALSGAIETAQGVYENGSAYGSTIQDAIDELKGAIETFQSSELNAPVDGKRYCIKVATADHAKLDNAVVVALGETSGNNPTGYTFQASAVPTAYLAQAFTFTQVSGNSYKISIEMPEGTVYLTNGTKNGSAADWKASQIQGTTDPEKAMEFTIKVSPNNGAFNIYNSETNSTIACQSGGNIYTEAGNADFALAEANEVGVELSIGADEIATRIFPFKPELPGDVVAYSCAADNGTNLTLVKVDTPAANTPYILYSESGCASTNLTGWGTAKEDSYTVGYLTGVFTRTAVPVNSYVLQKNNDILGFYKVSGEGQYSSPYRVYVTVSSGTGIKSYGFTLDDIETAIREAETEGQATVTLRYNAAGQQIQHAQKGLNIIRMSDGSVRKVLVK